MDVTLHSHNNLRDFLRIREEDHHQNNAAASTASRFTLLAMLADTRRPSPPPHSTRTLLDIIRDDPIPAVGCRRSWRQLRDRIRLRHRMVITHRRSTRFTSNSHPGESSSSSLRNVRVPNFGEEAAGRRSATEDIEERIGSGEQPARTSLMALLENDWQLRSQVSAHTLREEMKEEEEEEEEEIGGYNNCCVCMVRHKGAAFIPCGHTFCRVCSREVWVQRGHCPLCNNTILEILDIF